MPTINGFGSTAVDDVTIGTNAQGQLYLKKDLGNYDTGLSSITTTNGTNSDTFAFSDLENTDTLLLFVDYYMNAYTKDSSGYTTKYAQPKVLVKNGATTIREINLYNQNYSYTSESRDTLREQKTAVIPVNLTNDEKTNGVTLTFEVTGSRTPTNSDTSYTSTIQKVQYMKI